MADIRIKDLPLATGGTAPSGTDAVAIDGLTTRKATIATLGTVAVPIASQAEAETGTDASKRMTPLTVKQSISSEVGVTLASAAQGALSDTALQPGEAATTAQGAKADTALQPGQAATVAQGVLADQLPNVSLVGTPKALLRVNDAGSAFVPYINRLQKISAFDDRFISAAQWADMISGSPALDMSTPLQNAINYATSEKMILHIPQVSTLLSKQILSSSDLNIECDDHSKLKWTNTADAGWKVTGNLGSGRPGYGHVHLPELFGPNDTSGYTGVAANNNYTVNGFLARGLTIEDFIWGRFFTQYMSGWGSAVAITSNAYGSFNLSLDLGTIDLCKNGVEFKTANNKPVGQSRITADNIFAKFPLLFDVSSGGAIFEWDINALGVHNAEVGGSCVYTKGVTMTSPYTMTDVRVKGKPTSGYASNDSPNTVPTTYLGPLISGDQTGPAGVTGYADGGRNTFEFHMDDRLPSTQFSYKLKGNSDFVKVVCPLSDPAIPTTSIALSQTQGLANFNGGKPALHPLVRVSTALAFDLPAGNIADFYFYNELINAWANLPVHIVQIDNQAGIEVFAIPNGKVVPWECKIRLRNYLTTTITAGTAINFWIEIPYGH